MQVQNHCYSKNNWKNTKANVSKTNFKAIIIEQDIKRNIRTPYHPIIDHLENIKDKFENDKYWDLKVKSSCSAPLLVIKNKKHNNEYLLLPERIYERTYDKNRKKHQIHCVMNTPRGVSPKNFTPHVVSAYDKIEYDINKHHLFLTYDTEEEAREKAQKIFTLENQFLNTLSNGLKHSEFAYYYCNYPLYLLKEFENAAKNASKISTNNDTQTKESYIVKQGDKEITNGTKSLDQSDKKTGFAKVAGMNDLKETLKEDVILPLQQVELYKKYGIEPLNGIILYGPPGTGKTYIAEALAEESGRTFLKMNVAETESKWIGETPKNITKVFAEAEENAPSVIFIDELEALAPSRSNLDGSSSAAISYNQNVNTLLECMNNCSEKGIFVIGASNEPQKIDKAIKRAGRIDKNIFVPPPDNKARAELFKMYLENIYADENIDYNKLAELTKNYTAMEIKQVIIRQAALTALKQNRKISQDDLISQIEKYKPQLNDKVVNEYKTKGEINPEKKQETPRPKIGF